MTPEWGFSGCCIDRMRFNREVENPRAYLFRAS
jgi:hypothetical protein